MKMDEPHQLRPFIDYQQFQMISISLGLRNDVNSFLLIKLAYCLTTLHFSSTPSIEFPQMFIRLCANRFLIQSIYYTVPYLLIVFFFLICCIETFFFFYFNSLRTCLR